MSAMSAMSGAPLRGVRVLDLTRLLPGPVASLHLADLGAEVIKIEDHGAGDYARLLGEGPAGVSAFYRSVNRNISRNVDINRYAGVNRNINRNLNRNLNVNVNRTYAYRNGRRGYWRNGVWIAAPAIAGAAYGYGGSSCNYLYDQWQKTSSIYWRDRYRRCVNGN